MSAVSQYHSHCEAGFITMTLGHFIVTAGREGALELLEGILILKLSSYDILAMKK